MKEWIFSVVSTVLLTVIITIIVPEGRLGKTIKSIFSIIVMLIILKPVFLVYNVDFDLDIFNNFDIENEIQTDYIDYVNEIKKEKDKNTCLSILKDKQVEMAELEIYTEENETLIYSIKYVEINLSKAVIKSNKEHIVIIEEIKQEVSDALIIDKEKIVILI